ncbi:MAG: molecular chaperone DnaK [Betaproteobacteria bacterium HGW-Betaproteobacteria-18]|nr:MAG: molecular chaperone DnaK [Betaproteobacteria bacterium HGW-Betaproteobacteria-18]
MTSNSLATWRVRLQAELASQREAIAQRSAGTDVVELDQSSMGRVSRMDAMQQQAMAQATLQRLRTRQRKLEAALNRVDAGSYGLCCQCQETIEPERLQADAAAVFCSACAELAADQGRG